MMSRLIPDTIRARVLLVMIVGLTLSHALSVSMYFTDRTAALLFTGGEHIGERIMVVDELINRVPLAERQLMAATADLSKLHVTRTREPAIDEVSDGGWRTDVLRNALIGHFGEGNERIYRIAYVDEVADGPWRNHFRTLHKEEVFGATLLVSLKAKDGGWLNFAASVEPPEPFWSLRFGLSLLVMLLAVMILSAFVVRHFTKPLSAFARAANRLGVNLNAPSLPETGPSEVRGAAHAFNEMQDRIRRLVEDRTRMVAAISHDLGTPITRLRLRAEFVESEEQKEKMLADLNDMEVMVNAVMSFARDEASREPRVAVDLQTVIQRVCDDNVDAGASITLTASGKAVPYVCQPVAMRRVLTNLINNAVSYGKRARVSLKVLESGIEIQIDDDGPGIPAESQEDVFRPFQRLEGSRSRETGGVGLGLSVARTIVRGHGGNISLENRNEGGLRVTVYLPLQ